MLPLSKQFIAYGTALFLTAAGLSSCRKKDNLDKPQPIQVAAADSLTASPGYNSMMLTWVVGDAGVKKATAYCDNGDSVVVSFDGSSVMKATFTHLAEGNYSFSVSLTDANGHSSPRIKIVAHVYGDQYISSLVSRKLAGALFENGDVRTAWQTAPQTAIGTEIAYVNTDSDTTHLYIKPGEDSAILSGYHPGTYFRYRSMFKPVPQAIDTFYAPYSSARTFSVFSNPLLSDKGADPWVIYREGTYYFTYTTGNRIVLYATKKMSALREASAVTVWTPPSGSAYSKEIWAPEMHFLDNKWYIYFAADDGTDAHHRMYVIENDAADPLQGSWTFRGELQEPSDQWAIDGTVLSLQGSLYMIWSGKTNGVPPQQLYICQMSNPYTLEGSRIAISTPVYSWEKNGAAINEGPEILKNKAGNVFLVYSASGFWTDDYCLGMLALRPGGDPLTPSDWTKSPDPVFRKDADAGAFAPGHCSFFTSRDGTEDWILYHARSFPNGGSTNHRNPRIQRFTWNTDGTPDFGVPAHINTELQAPSGEF